MRASLAPTVLFVVMGSFSFFSARPALAGPMSCPGTRTLEDLVTCIRSHMPGSGSGAFVSPTSAEKTALRGVTQAMLEGNCTMALPPVLSGLVETQVFFDEDSERRYCVLLEVLDAAGDGVVDRGLGTFIVDSIAERALSHQAPHAIADSNTELEAVAVFKATRSESFLMAGAHRNASTSGAACVGDSYSSDVAHDTNNMFYTTNEVLRNYHGSGEYWAIQWHGMAGSTCSANVHLANGLGVSPSRSSRIVALRRAILHENPSWSVTLPGSQSCSLDATENVEGRLLNGVPSGAVCSTQASSSAGRFFHIEQDPGFRDPSDWINAIEATFPTL